MELAFLIFLSVTAGLLATFRFVAALGSRSGAGVRRRLQEEFRTRRPEPDAPKTLFKDLDVLNLSLAEEYAMLGAGGNPPRRLSVGILRSKLERALQEAGVALRPGWFLILAAALAVGTGLAAAWLGRWPGGLIGGAAGLALPFGLLHLKRQARRDRLIDQLPRAFELMARVLRAGQSVPQAFQAVGDAFEEPLAGEFARCQQQQNLGLPPEVVLQELARRSGILELRIFVMAMLVQRQAGGNLAEVLDRLAALMRTRLRLRRQVRTLTAEGRLQGLTLVVLPFVLYAALLIVNRPYAAALLDHPLLVDGTLALMLIGVLWIQKIVDCEG